MAIDPLLYEKVSGRSGDPYSRLGEALAQNDAVKSKRAAQKDTTFSSRMTTSYFKYRMIAGIIGSVILLIVVLLVKLFK